MSSLCILYDSTYCKDLVTRTEEAAMTVNYQEHPQKVCYFIEFKKYMMQFWAIIYNCYYAVAVEQFKSEFS